MTAPRPSLPDPLAELGPIAPGTTPRPLTPEQAAARALEQRHIQIPDGRSDGSPSPGTRRSPKPIPRADRRSTPDRRSGRTFGPSPRQYNRHR